MSKSGNFNMGDTTSYVDTYTLYFTGNINGLKQDLKFKY